MMQVSVNRMSGLIDNVMDFARARLGGGMQLRLKEESSGLASSTLSRSSRMCTRTAASRRRWMCRERSKSMRDGWTSFCPTSLEMRLPMVDLNAPITVVAKAIGRGFEISVANKGPRIPDEAMPLLFTAFHRGEVLPNEKGLGLGLYISQEIARAHGGQIRVTSTAEQTIFTAEFPLALVDGPSKSNCALEFHNRAHPQNERVFQRHARHGPGRIGRATAGMADVLDIGLQREAAPHLVLVDGGE